MSTTDSPKTTITITLNGKQESVPVGMHVGELVNHCGANPDITLVERNRSALFKREWQSTTIEPGDEIEFVRIVAGG